MERLADQFEFLCKDVLQANGIQVSYLVETEKHLGDLIAFQKKDGDLLRTLIETKFYRSDHIPFPLLNKTMVKLIDGMKETRSDSALLIVSINLPHHVKNLLKKVEFRT